MREAVQPGEADKGDVSRLLRAWSHGHQRAFERLTPIVHDELHRPASRYMKRERSGHSPLTTALVDEAHMRLDLAALDDAMIALGRLDPRKVQVVEMRFFGGLSVEQTAEVLSTAN